jgi:hypothetical protein
VLQRPIWNLWWCWNSGEWPSWYQTVYLFFQVCATIVFLPVLGLSGISHILQYVDNDTFVHTSFGRVRAMQYKDLCPGMLDTAIILHPRNDGAFSGWSESIQASFLKMCERPIKLNIWGFIRAPFVRYFPTRFSFREAELHASSVVNCAEAVAKGWMEGGGVCFHKELGVAPNVLFPTDFLRSNRFVRCETCLRVPVKLEPHLKDALSRWLDFSAPIPCMVVKPVDFPTFHIFGPFPPQFYHTARQQYLQVLAAVQPMTIKLTPTVCHDRSTHHLFLPASCDRLLELAKTLDQIIPSTTSIILQHKAHKTTQNHNREPGNRVNIYTLSPSFSQKMPHLAPQNIIHPKL